jgi:predicted ATPase
LGFALRSVIVVHQFRSERQAVQEWAEKLIALSNEQGFAYWLAWGTIFRGWALAKQEEGEEEIAQIRQGLAAHRATEAELAQPYFLALLAEAYGRIGKAEEGLTVLAEALDVVNKNRERFYEAELYRLNGELLLALSQENQVEAETCFHKAIEVARWQSAKSLELRTVMNLSRLWQRQGKREEARQMLSLIYGWFTEGFETADLKEAKALLEELS